MASRRLTALLLALVAFALFLNVPIPTFAIALSPNQSCTVTVSTSGDITVVAGSSGSNTITITLSQGSCGGPLDLAGCTPPPPSGTSCDFVPSSGNPTFSTILTISTSPSTPPGTYSLDISLSVAQCACELTQLSGANDPFNLIVQPAAVTTTTSVNCSPSSINVGSSSSCTATVSGASGSINGETISWSQSGGTGSVTFPSGTTCTLSGTSCSINVNGASVGNPTIQASYPGDSNNAPSSGTQSLSVNPPPSVSLSANPSSIMVTAGSSGMTTVTVNLIGFPSIGNPMVTCTGLPTGATCSTNPSPLPSFLHNGDQFTLTVTASSSTTPGTYQVTVQLTFLQPTMIRPIFLATSPIMFGSSGGVGPSAVSTQATSNPLTITVVVNAPTPPTPIPEYPVGLPILAIFMALAYVVIKRRTRNPKNM